MGFFNSSKKDESDQKKFEWIDLESIEELESIMNASFEDKVLIFKHSTRCSISRMALKQFENEFKLPENLKCYYLDLLNFRGTSNEIASKLDVLHQSPQVLVIHKGFCISSFSHSEIQADEILKVI